MKWILTIAVAICAIVLGAAWALQQRFTPNTFYYRLTIDLEVDGKLVSGSSVYLVSVLHQPNIGMAGGWTTAAFGEAVAIDMGYRGVLFALLKGKDACSDAGQIVYCNLPPPNVPKGSTAGAALPANIERYQKQILKAELVAEQLPMLVRFRDLSDPTSIEQVDPTNLAKSFGPGVKFSISTLQTTTEPPTKKIKEYLPWLKNLKGGYLNSQFTARGAPLELHAGDFER